MNVKHYRPISIIEKLIKDQITPYINKYLSTFIPAYSSSYRTQHVLLKLIRHVAEQT